jgi:predicted kinase
MSEKIVYLMRGLPSCGKSTMAKRLVADGGVIFETDEYFYTQVGTDPTKFNYKKELQQTACDWNFERFCRAVDEGISPIVVDRGNSRSLESRRYARYARDRGYELQLVEPDSPWWQEIRVLLKYRKLTRPALYEWADKLAEMSRSTHRVPARTIRDWMDGWKWDLTIEEILNFEPEPEEEEEDDDEDENEDTQAAAEPPKGLVSADDEPSPLEAGEEPVQEARILKPGERSPFL